MKKCLHISSAVPANITLATGDSFYVGEKKVHLLVENNIFCTFTPYNSKYLSYSFNLPANNSETIKAVPYYNHHIDIYLSPTKSRNWQEVHTDYQKIYGKIKILVSSDDNFSYINIFLDEECKYYTAWDKVQDISSEANSFVMIFANNKTSPYSLVLDENFKPIINGKCQLVENEQQKLKILINNNDIAKHGTVYDFDKINNTYESYLVYLNDTPHDPDNARLIPMAFLQAIKCNNLKLALTYMKNNHIPALHLKNYFGKIYDAYYNVYDANNINYTVIGEVIKSYNFTLDGDKITDIEEVNINI